MDDETFELSGDGCARKRPSGRREDSFLRPLIDASQPELIASKSIFEYLDADDPVHWLIALRDGLSLSLFRPVSTVGGYSYDPRMLFLVWVLALWDGETSSRRIEKKMRTDVRYIVLGGGLRPDHATFCRFRRDQGDAFVSLLAKTVQMAVERGLVDMRRAHLDGTRLPGNVSQWRKLCQEAEAADAADDPSGPDDPPDPPQKGSSDPDARNLATRRGFVNGYNAQTIVDGRSGIALCGHVSANSSDGALLEPTLQACLEVNGALPDELVADKGYDTPANAHALEELGMRSYIPSHFKSFWKLNEQGKLSCPAGHVPSVAERMQIKGVRILRQIITECPNCPKRESCAVKRRKTIRTPEGVAPERWIAMHERAASPDGKVAAKERSANVERTFAHTKERMRFRRFSLRGLKAVGDEWQLVLTAHNLMRLRTAELLNLLCWLLQRIKMPSYRFLEPATAPRVT